MKALIIILVSVFLITGCWQDSDIDNNDTSVIPIDTDTQQYTNINTLTIDEEKLIASIPAEKAENCALIETPFDKCSDNNLIIFTGEVTFYNGQCNFSFILEECLSSCQRTEDTDHQCVMPCDSMLCNTPPEDYIGTSSIGEYYDIGLCVDEVEDAIKIWGNWNLETIEEPFCHYENDVIDYDCENNEYLIYNTEIQDYECYTCPDGQYVEVIVIDGLAAGYECR